MLEKNLQGLPERVGALETRVTELTVQFVQFRDEVRIEFSAVRKETSEAFLETHKLMFELHQDALRQSKIQYEDLLGRIALLKNT